MCVCKKMPSFDSEGAHLGLSWGLGCQIILCFRVSAFNR